MKEENINALDEIHKGAYMGMDAIKFTLDKVEDETFKEVLQKDYDDYQTIAQKIEKIYPEYDDDDPHKTNTMNKVMTKSGIEMKTMNDHSNSKIAELLLQGMNMGIIEGRRILNQKKIDEKVRDIVSEYVNMQEKSMDTLKNYL